MDRECKNPVEIPSLPFFASVDKSLVAPAGDGICSEHKEGRVELLEDAIYYSAGNTVNTSGIWSPS